MELTQKYVQYLFDYNELSGILKWKNKTSPKSRNKIGKEAGCIDSHGYRVVTIHNKFYNTQQIIWLYVYGYMSNDMIDHINHVKTDNRLCNLREVNNKINQQNRSGAPKNSSTGVTGVHYRKNRDAWWSDIHIDGKVKYLGYFKDFDKAVMARWVAEKKYNWPNYCTTSTAYIYLKCKNLL